MANSFTVAGSDPNVGGVYPQQWATKLQERLDKPTNWKEVANVMYSDVKYFNMPYMSTESVIQTGTRGTAYGFSDFTLTNDQMNIGTYKPVPIFIDRADLAQCDLVRQSELADRQGSIINEWLEQAMLADHAAMTNFGDTGGGVLGLASTAITVTASNVDDIIRGIKREVRVANGQDLAARNGYFIIWRPADFELLEAYVQANGFTEADSALKDGTLTGFRYMGVDHYVTNSNAANHIMGGVKKIYQIGILKTTYGQVVVTQDPNLQSGIGIISRIDYGLNLPTAHAGLVFDINVA